MTAQELFSANLRRLRRASHLTQEALGERAGLHRTYIGGIEQGHVNVSLKNIGKIADALGVELAELFAPMGEAGACAASAADARRGYAAGKAAMPHAHGMRSGVLAATAVPREGQAGWQSDLLPVEPAHVDLTSQVVFQLMEAGYEGDALASRYDEVVRQVRRLVG